MGATREQGVIDDKHRVFGYDGLYVIDGAAMSANPGGAATTCTVGPSSFRFFLQLLEQSLDAKIGSRELVHEHVLCRRPLRGASQQLVDSPDLRNQFGSVHRASKV
jgi:GMC oxidoreductase